MTLLTTASARSTARRWLVSVVPVSLMVVLTDSRMALGVAVVTMGLIHVATTERTRREFASARRRLVDHERRTAAAERLALGQAEILELIASGASPSAVQTVIGDWVRDETGGAWTAGATGLVSTRPAAPDVSPQMALVIERLLEVTRERDRIHSALTHQATHDALTGLVNRTTVLDRLDHLMRRRRRVPDIAVLFLDLDRFKQVNDSLGHEVGDALLVEVAERIRHSVRDGDTVGRLGGDEFAVVLEDVTVDEARRVADRMSKVISEPLSIGGVPIDVAASIGIAMPEVDDRDADKVLREADQAMYRAKKGSRGVVEADDALREWSRERHEIELRLREAITDDDLVLHYQPVVDTATGTVRGVEALVRLMWQGRMLSPALFLQVAEETGQIAGIDRLVLAAAARQVAVWNREHGTRLDLAVNLSGAHVVRAGVVDEITGALARSGLPADRLVVEITESVLLSDADAVARRLDVLRRRGVKVAVDDFGTGYSSLTYLQRLPVDILKIDRAFVDRLGHSDGDDAIVRAIIELAAALDLDVIAEGVEDTRQRDTLARLGCPASQGYLFSRPLPAEEFATTFLAGLAARAA